MSGLPSIPTPVQVVHAGLRAIDGGLENLSLVAEAVHRSYADLPPVTSDFVESAPDSKVSQGIEFVRAQVRRGLPVTAPPGDIIDAGLNLALSQDGFGGGVDDRKMGLEYLLVALSRTPPGSKLASDLEHKAISLLYRDLPHPPSTLMGPKFQFREYDGSGNSQSDPTMGKSFTPYSRSCSTSHPLPASELPDPGLLFDSLIKRDKFVPHPAGLSGLFFNYATTVIHSVFRTSRTDWNINETSSYVDLGILYGNTEAHIDKLRVKDGRGRILPDVFAETRIANLPPGVGALLIAFNRNHNWIVDRLIEINERGNWTTDLESLSDDDKKQQDDEIFQTARLINSATYAMVVLGDYLAAILGTVRDGSSWTLNISGERREKDHTLLERGQGNSCSVEFNTLYRLHPTMSEDDEKFTQAAFQYIFKKPRDDLTFFDTLTPEEFEINVALAGKDIPGGLSPEEYIQTLSKEEREALKDDSKPVDLYEAKYSIKGVQRDPVTKRYNDDQLAAALQNATRVPGGAFKARGVPGVMRVIEILGIEQARNWGCCSLNDFRRFLGLKPYATFEEWNPDPVVAETARKLYRSPENLELYVGLVAEESKPVMDGAGLCPSYTMSRAILADAVALVRGDRYLTYDFTPFNLTAWGFTEANRDVDNAAWGGMLGRVISRAFPRHYDAESVYTHFPLVTPTGQPLSIDVTLKKLGLLDQYSILPPVKTGEVHVVADPNAIYAALSEEGAGSNLKTLYLQNIKDIKLSPSFLTVIDDAAAYARVTKLVQEVFVPKESLAATVTYFYDKTIELLREKSFTLADKTVSSVDLVKDVLRLIPVHWSSTQVAGLPLKTSFEPRGIYYEQQMYQMLKEIYTFIYLEADKSVKIPQRAEAKQNVERLLRFVKLSLQEAKGGLPASVLGAVSSLVLGDGRGHVNAILKRLLNLGSPIDEIANDVVGVISTASIELSQIYAHVVNAYLAPNLPSIYAQKAEKDAYQAKVDLQAKVASVAQANAADSPALLEGYVREALRLDPVVPGIYREAVVDGSVGPIEFKKGDRLYFDFIASGKNEDTFTSPGPEVIDPTRPAGLYNLLHGDGVFKVLGEDFVYKTAAAVLKAVFSQPGLKRTNGPTGTLRRFKEPLYAPAPKVLERVVGGTDKVYSLEDGEGDVAVRYAYADPENANRLTTWATGLVVSYNH